MLLFCAVGDKTLIHKSTYYYIAFSTMIFNNNYNCVKLTLYCVNSTELNIRLRQIIGQNFPKRIVIKSIHYKAW